LNSQGDQEPIRPFETITGDAVGYCIYCGGTDGLSKEHIVPYFLAGGFTLPKASCKECSKITQKFEEALSYTFFFALRRRYNIQRRSKRGSVSYPIILKQNGQDSKRSIPFSQLPAVVVWPFFDEPGILIGQNPNNTISGISFTISNVSDLFPGPHTDGTFEIEINLHYFLRLMAKIAHGMFIFNNKDPSWQPLLQDTIRFGYWIPFYVGNFTEQLAAFEPASPPPKASDLTPIRKIWSYVSRIQEDRDSEYLVTVIDPFLPGRSPRYEVVTARRPLPGWAILQNAKQMQLPISPQTQFISDPVRVVIEAETGDHRTNIPFGPRGDYGLS